MYVVKYSLLTLLGGTFGLPICLLCLGRLVARSVAAGQIVPALLMALGIAEGVLILFVWWSNPVVLRVSETSVIGRSLLGRKTTWLRSEFSNAGEIDLVDHIAGTFEVRDESGRRVFRLWTWMMHNGKRLEEDLRACPTKGMGLSNE